MGCTGSKKKEPKPQAASAPPAATGPSAAVANDITPASPPPATGQIQKPPVNKAEPQPQQAAAKQQPAAKNVSLLLGIPTSLHHTIIGKGGSTIKELQSANNVRITVERGSNTVVIEGLQRDANNAKQKLSDLLHFDICEGSLTHIELDVPKGKYGAIIGSRGATVKEIQRMTRAAVHVPSSGEKGGVTISGTAKACEKAVKSIEDKVGSRVTRHNNSSEAIAIKIPDNSYDLNVKVSRVLFFPDHVEDDKQRTFDVFIRFLGSAQKTLDICIFALTNDRIAETVLNSHRRGVAVRVICDDDQAQSKGADIHKLKTAGITVRMDMSQFHMHNKYVLILWYHLIIISNTQHIQ